MGKIEMIVEEHKLMKEDQAKQRGLEKM